MRNARTGQAMIESMLVILVISLLFFSLLQLAQAFAGREILRHASARAARARTVGFNGWMCKKVMRVAAIPNAGKMLEPDPSLYPDTELQNAVKTKKIGALWDWALTATPSGDKAAMEAARIPEYLASEHENRADYILDYERWDDIKASGLGGGGGSGLNPGDKLEVKLRQKLPLDISVKALIDWVGVLTPSYDKGYMMLGGDYGIEDHYSLYIDDEGR